MIRSALLIPLLAAAAGLPARTLAQEVTPAAPPPATLAPPAAEPPPAAPVLEVPKAPPPRGPFAVGAQLGMFSGIGAAIQLGTPVVGVRVAGGWAPLLLAVTERTTVNGRTTDETPKVKFYSGGMVAPDLYVRVAQTRTAAIGLQAGYRYSSLLGSGGAGGVYFQVPLGRSVDVLVNGGLLVFPDGEDRLKEKEHLQDAEFGFPGPNANIAISVGLLFFP